MSGESRKLKHIRHSQVSLFFYTLLQNNPIPSHLYMRFKKSVGNVLLYMRFREEQKKAHVYNTLLHALYKKERMYMTQCYTCALSACIEYLFACASRWTAHVYDCSFYMRLKRMYMAMFTCALSQRAHVEVLLKISIFLNNISMHRMNLYVITCLILIYIKWNHHKYI